MNLKQFLSSPGKVIITDKVANINRLIKRCNRYEGIDIVDCRVMSFSQVVRGFVTAYAAIYEPDKRYRFISPAMSTLIMQIILKNQKFISVPEESKCTGTSGEILRSLNIIRLNAPTQAFANGTGTKLSEMKQLLKLYEEELSGRSELDYPMLLDKAVGYIDSILGYDDPSYIVMAILPWLTSDIGLFYGKELCSKEKVFLDKLEQAAGKVFEHELKLEADKARPKTDRKAPEYHFFEAYGIDAEVRYVADKIRKNKMYYGDVVVIYTSDEYENMLRREFENNNIIYTFADGFHVASENYITFMLDLISFVNEDYLYQSLEKVISNPIVNVAGIRRSYRKVLSEGIGWSRKRYEDFISRYKSDAIKDAEYENIELFISFLKEMLAVFDERNSCEQIFNGLIKLTNDHTYRADQCRIMIADQLKAQAKAFSVIGKEEKFADKLLYISDFLKELRLPIADTPDSVAIYRYGEPIITDRSHLFVLGLSNENIAGTITESPVFSDDELLSYAEGILDLACERSIQKRACFEQTLRDFDGEDIYLGYSDFDTVKLLDNSRSLLYSNHMLINGITDADIEKTGYSIIEGNIKLAKENFYKAYADNAEVEETDKDKEKSFMPMYFSASSLQTLLYCPLQFYYQKIEHIPSVEHLERTPDRWLMPNQKGNLFHKTLEDYVNAALVQDEKKSVDMPLLEQVYNSNIAKALSFQPCPSKHIFEDEKNECFEAILRYVKKLHEEINASTIGKKVIGCEVGFSEYPYSGGNEYTNEENGATTDLRYDICFSGSADRVDGYVENGILNLEIIDYKTGSAEKKIKEISEEVQIQHYVYAICIKKWTKDNLDMLEKRFGQHIADCKIVSMHYDFPFEDDQDVVDASEKVTGDAVRLPGNADSILELTVGAIQHGHMDVCRDFIDTYLNDKITAEKENNKDVDFCRYCNYTQVCRRKL